MAGMQYSPEREYPVRVIHSKHQESVMHTRKKTVLGMFTWGIGIAFALCCLGCFEGKNEINLKLSECPEAVQKAIRDSESDVRFPKITRETKDKGLIVYKVMELKPDGTRIDIVLTADGKIIDLKTGKKMR